MKYIGEREEVIPTRYLSDRDRDIFLALLEADTEPNEAIKAAAAEYNKGWYVDGIYHFRLPAFDPKADVEPHGTGDEAQCGF